MLAAVFGKNTASTGAPLEAEKQSQQASREGSISSRPGLISSHLTTVDDTRFHLSGNG
jgi:hypothetical protein